LGTIGLGLLVLAMLQTDLPAKPGPTTGAIMRHSFWREQFEKARRIHTWHEVERVYTRLTAAQTCVDIRAGRRVVGIHPGEKWDAQWERINPLSNDAKVYIRMDRIAAQ
jgi:hypothetical protein